MSKIYYKIETLFEFEYTHSLSISNNLDLFVVNNENDKLIVYDLLKKERIFNYQSDLKYSGGIKPQFTSDSKNLYFSTYNDLGYLSKINLETGERMYFNKLLIDLSKNSNKYICYNNQNTNFENRLTVNDYETQNEYEGLFIDIGNTKFKAKFIDNDTKIAFSDYDFFKIYDLDKKEIIFSLEAFDELDFNYDVSKGLYEGTYYYGYTEEFKVIYGVNFIDRGIYNFDIFENKLALFLAGYPSLVKLVDLDDTNKRQYFDISEDYKVDLFERKKSGESINLIMNGDVIVCSTLENLIFVFDVKNNTKIAEFETSLENIHSIYIPNKSNFMILPDKNGYISLVTFYESDE